jgi:TPR repeat protein
MRRWQQSTFPEPVLHHVIRTRSAGSRHTFEMEKEEDIERRRWRVHELFTDHMWDGNLDRIAKAASSGDCLAKVRLGLCYEHGEATPEDRDKALKLYEEAAFEGLPEAQYRLAMCLLMENPESARGFCFLRDAAGQGLEEAMVQMGRQYYSGVGTKQDHRRAAMFFESAAEAGSVEGLLNLALCHLMGQGKMMNRPLGVELLRAAGRSGSEVAKFHLGVCYLNGWGVKKKAQRAKELFSVAAEAGVRGASELLNRLKDL